MLMEDLMEDLNTIHKIKKYITTDTILEVLLILLSTRGLVATERAFRSVDHLLSKLPPKE